MGASWVFAAKGFDAGLVESNFPYRRTFRGFWVELTSVKISY